MRRILFNLTIALLAFGLSSFIVFRFCWQTVEQSVINKPVINKKIEFVSDIKVKDAEIKYRCKETELVSFWEKLDKEDFLKAAKVQMKEFYGRSKPDITQIEWDIFIKNFNCEYFYNLEKKDLNNDGNDEIFVRGSNLSNRGDKSLYVFREIDGKLQLILYTFTGREIEIINRKNKEFPQIKVKSEYFTHGGRRIESYQFNGKIYNSTQCFREYEWETDVKGNIINYTKPVIRPCD